MLWITCSDGGNRILDWLTQFWLLVIVDAQHPLWQWPLRELCGNRWKSVHLPAFLDINCTHSLKNAWYALRIADDISLRLNVHIESVSPSVWSNSEQSLSASSSVSMCPKCCKRHRLCPAGRRLERSLYDVRAWPSTFLTTLRSMLHSCEFHFMNVRLLTTIIIRIWIPVSVFYVDSTKFDSFRNASYKSSSLSQYSLVNVYITRPFCQPELSSSTGTTTGILFSLIMLDNRPPLGLKAVKMLSCTRLISGLFCQFIELKSKYMASRSVSTRFMRFIDLVRQPFIATRNSIICSRSNCYNIPKNKKIIVWGDMSNLWCVFSFSEFKFPHQVIKCWKIKLALVCTAL